MSAEYVRRKKQLYQIGCIVCLNELDIWCPPEPHHIRAEGSAGKRAPDDATIPLCHSHHRTGGYGVAFHAGPEEWQERWGSERELLEQVNMMIREPRDE